MKEKAYHTITLFDFEKLCREHGIKKYTYSTLEQEWTSVQHTIAICFSGDKMLVQLHPGRIALVCQDNELLFEMVKYVRVYNTQDLGCMRFGIVCGKMYGGSTTEHLVSAF